MARLEGDRLKAGGLVALIVVALAVAVYGVLGLMGGNALEQANQDEANFVNGLAAKSGGDYDKLSAEEQERLDALTKGKGREVLRYHPMAGKETSPVGE